MTTDMEFAGSVREKFAKNSLYTDDKLVDLANIIAKNLNYLFDSFIPVPNNCEIILFLKDININKDCLEFYKILEPSMQDFFKNYKTELYSMLSESEVERFYSLPKALFYYVQILGNGIIIKL